MIGSLMVLNGKQFVEDLLHQGPPVIVAFLAWYLGAAWYVAVLIMLLSQYWYGPILVYLRQRMPSRSAIRAVEPDAVRPAAHEQVIAALMRRLQSAGFLFLGRVSGDAEKKMTSTAALFQHPGTSDVAHLMIATQEGHASSAEMVMFSRVRIDGSRLLTVRSSIPSPFPPNPSDSVLMVEGDRELMDLWGVHRVRTAADAGVRRNETVSDVFEYQTRLEIDGVRRHIRSGVWQQDERPGLLRPTAWGAVVMCLRMLPPWRQLSRVRSEMLFRRYLKEARSQE